MPQPLRPLSLLLLLAASLSLSANPAHALSCYDAGFSRLEFPFCQLLSPKYALHWNMARDNSSLTLGVLAETPGWAAVGFSESGGMFGANIFAIEKKAPAYALTNYYSTRPNVMAVSKAAPSAILASAKFENGILRAVIRKVLDEDCDYLDTRVKAGYMAPVIWAHGESDVVSYHSVANRGDTQISFVPTPILEVQNDDSNTIDIKMYNVTIPKATTTYLCSYYALPNATKYHVTRTEPLIQARKYVHHMIVYGCTNDLDTSFIGTTRNCESMVASCNRVMMAWAPGSIATDYPSEAGFPIGVGPNAVKYVALQTHYNNVNGDEGNVDASGIRLIYTSKLRASDLGVIVTGSIGINIPPNTPNHTLPWNVCPPGCTSQFDQPANIVGMRYHMHETGRRFQTRIIRNGTEVPNAYKDYFDFNYQITMRPHPKNTQIMPGDTLISRCAYDTTGRVNTTKFGESTEDEMCFNFIMYYPYKPTLGYCITLAGNLALCGTDADAPGVLRALGTSNTTQIREYMARKVLVTSVVNPEFTPLREPVCIDKTDSLISDPAPGSNETAPGSDDQKDTKNSGTSLSLSVFASLISALVLPMLWI